MADFFNTIEQFNGQDILWWKVNWKDTFKVWLCIQLAEPLQSASKSLAMERNLEVKNPTQSGMFCLFFMQRSCTDSRQLKREGETIMF